MSPDACDSAEGTDTTNGHSFGDHKNTVTAPSDGAIARYQQVPDCFPSLHEAAFLAETLIIRDGSQDAGGYGAVEVPSSTQFAHRWLADLMNRLASGLRTCKERDDPQLLDDVVSGYLDAELHCAAGQPEWVQLQINHAIALVRRFENSGQEQDLDEAIKRKQDILSRITENDSDYWRLLNNLGNALTTRFELRGYGKDLDEAIRYHGDALLAIPTEDPDRCLLLNNLGGALWTRFEHRGNAPDLDAAIQYLHSALLLTPAGHPNRSVSLNNVATALTTRFELRGDPNDLDEAIRYHRDVLLLRPIGCPDHSVYLNNLATALKARFRHRGDEHDLEEVIQCHRDALLLRPIGHPQRSESLHNLAGALRTRFSERGDMDDLDEAIQCHHDALSLTSSGHTNRSASLTSLATSLSTRFEQRGDVKDLEKALEYHRGALLLRPAGHPYRSTSLSNLAITLSRLPKWRAFDEAIRYHYNALSLKPIGHPDRPRLLSNLALAAGDRFYGRGNWNDLGEAIQLHRDALSLAPGRLATSTGLAIFLGERFEHQGDRKDVDEALQICRLAGARALPGHPNQLPIYRTLAKLYLALWNAHHIDTHFQNAMDHYKAAADVESAGLLPRLNSCLVWVCDGEKHGHGSTLEAYEKLLQLLDVHVSAAASISDRHQTMKHFPVSLAVDAASCALRRGDVPHGLELLEQGRVLLWNQMVRFRTALDDLPSRDNHAAALAQRFRELSFLLSRQPTGERSTGDTSAATVEAEARRYRHLVNDWNKVITEIRTLDGFSRFLLPPLFSDLQEAACEGPVIVLVASKFSCDAIIVLHDEPPVHIALATDLQKLEKLAGRLRKQTFVSREPNKNVIIEVLRELWTTVVSLVVSKLERFVDRGSRIWWCPTSIFTLFPLHAAGGYQKGAPRSVAELYVSSYTPSLSALIKARRSKHTTSSPVHFAAIGQALPAERRTPLEMVEKELDEIESHLPPSTSILHKAREFSLDEGRSTPCITELIPGSTSPATAHKTSRNQFKSCLAMRDGPLSLLDIINSDLTTHEFAFLSACKTAVGDLSTPDEVIHLAAGLQFMGVKSVVGTLWRVDDAVAHNLVSKFYKEFCAGDEMDCTRAARALRKAFMLLGQEKVPLEDRIMLIHIGI
ncbi:CHAT domain-containing protein [Phlebopus sp. FC_14]|nr:CHAT domain-containing protein [Phlebopus sp. FC_14]